MGKFSSFEEINSWQRARLLNKRIYEVTGSDNFKNDFDLGRQIRRASYQFLPILQKGLKEIQIRNLFISCMLQKAQQVK